MGATGGSSTSANIRDATLAAACAEQTNLFLTAMDDDFNTAGAIAALFEMAGAINRFIEHNKLESEPRPSGGTPLGPPLARGDGRSDALTATQHLISVARIIGLFLDPPTKKTGGDDGLADAAMQVLIAVRQHLRKKKDFETSDLIRNLLAEQKITLEDRPDGTLWRTE